jgi:predicted DNA-binding protein (MmcQ/YjbR family)
VSRIRSRADCAAAAIARLLRLMTPAAFNAFCRKLPAATYVCQWGGSHVWKVGGKVFAIGSWDEPLAGITFKVTPLGFEILREQPGLRPAPYLASRGMKWIQHHAEPGLPDRDLKRYLRLSHELVARGLTRKMRAALGLEART